MAKREWYKIIKNGKNVCYIMLVWRIYLGFKNGLKQVVHVAV